MSIPRDLHLAREANQNMNAKNSHDKLTKPLISVIVPAYNSERTIGGCLRSLLSQTIDPASYEVIVADNGSTDQTAEIIKQHPVLYLSAPDCTVYGARNEAVRMSQGKYLAFTDGDCTADPHWLEEGLRALETYEMAGGRIEPQESRRGLLYAYDKYVMRPSTYVMKVYNPGAGNIFVRRGLFDRVGGFHAEASTAADSIFAMQLRELGLEIGFAESAVIFHPVDGLIRRLRGALRKGNGSAMKAPYVYRNHSRFRRNMLRCQNACTAVRRDLALVKKAWRKDQIAIGTALCVCCIAILLSFAGYAGVISARLLGPINAKLARR